MLAPLAVQCYACPCGGLVLEVAGPSWVAWDLAAARATEHARTRRAARGQWWIVETPDDGGARTLAPPSDARLAKLASHRQSRPTAGLRT